MWLYVTGSSSISCATVPPTDHPQQIELSHFVQVSGEMFLEFCHVIYK